MMAGCSKVKYEYSGRTVGLVKRGDCSETDGCISLYTVAALHHGAPVAGRSWLKPWLHPA